MKIGLALAGGGLQAFAYIGVFKAFEEMGIKPNFISGTSSGSVFAALYALGFSRDEMKNFMETYYKEFTKIKKTRIIGMAKDYMFTGEMKTEGLIDGKIVEDVMEKIAPNKKMQDIEMPLAIATVDTISSKECNFLSRKCEKVYNDVDYIYDINLSTAVRASMAFPGIFTTCNFEKYNFIDGGTKDNLPVKILKDMGADFTIGLSFDISHYEPSMNILKVILRAVDLFSQKDVINAQKITDIPIEIYTGGTSLMEINNMELCIDSRL